MGERKRERGGRGLLSWLTRYRGRAIAIRLAEDGFDVCINDIEGNRRLVDEVCGLFFYLSLLLYFRLLQSSR